MSQIRLTNDERIQALKRLDYSEREAAFLCLAALHGGYFLRRQYGQFLSQSPGGNAAALIEKVLDKGHASGTTYATNTHIYHLNARPFYAALGQEDNRNRRLRQPATIKNKLMGLDFVLAHSDRQYLATEQEKVDYFTGTLKLEALLLPVKRYTGRGPAGERYCDRYFVEKFPISLSPSSGVAKPPVVAFTYIDEGQAGLSGFSTFLQHYASLLGHLPQFQLIFVAANCVHFEAAAAAFERFVGQIQSAPAVPDDGTIRRMLQHFEARRLHESRQWSSFDRAKLIRFRDDRHEFSGDKFDALYRVWSTNGGAAVEAVLSRQTASAAPVEGTFLSCRLEQNYDFFGSATTY
jgi:hypothetical protein